MDSSQLRVVVTWANPSAPNLGVRVLAEGSALLVRGAFGAGTIVEFPIFEDEPLRSTLSTRSLIVGRLGADRRLRDYLKDFDLLVEAGGGDSFTDIYGLARLIRMDHIHRAARRAGVPVVFGPQTVGPFNSAVGCSIGSRMLQRSAVVLARDSESAAHATKLGRKPDALTTDVVFMLPEPLATVRRDIVVNVSGLLWSGSSHTDPSLYRQNVRTFIGRAHAEGRAVTILPHVLDNGSPDNDVPVSLELAAEFGDRVEVVVPSSLEDARTILGSASFVVGSRMHACLNALSAGTPAFPWAYSRKFLPLMNDIGWPVGVDLRSGDDVAEITLAYLRSQDVNADAERVRSLRDVAKQRLEQAQNELRHIALVGAL